MNLLERVQHLTELAEGLKTIEKLSKLDFQKRLEIALRVSTIIYLDRIDDRLMEINDSMPK